MSVISVQRGFGFSTGTLVRDAQRLLGALKDGTLGTPVVAHFSPTFVTDFEARIALVAKLGSDQSGAIGSVGTLSLSRTEALADYVRIAAAARRAAKLAFAGQDTLLRSEFLVGLRGPRDLPRVLEGARRLLAGCQRYAAELLPHGWSATGTEMLEDVIETLASFDRDREAAADGKQGLTAQRTATANWLYQQCIAVQNIARLVYPVSRAANNPAVVEARARFLLDEFPPRLAPTVETLPEPSDPEPALPEVVTPAPTPPSV